MQCFCSLWQGIFPYQFDEFLDVGGFSDTTGNLVKQLSLSQSFLGAFEQTLVLDGGGHLVCQWGQRT